MTDYAGIDYSLGTANFDKNNGIHFGVISQNSVLQSWADSSEADYGPPCCPKCGCDANRPEEFGETFEDGRPDDYTDEPGECDEFVCVNCKHFFGTESAYGDEPLGFYVDDGEYRASCGQDGDIFITKSPYYTHAQFCSPCAPGAGYLKNPCPTGPKTYCFGVDWFDESIEPCPYPVYRVDTDELIYTPADSTDE